MDDQGALIRDALHAPVPAIDYVLNEAIGAAFAGSYVMRTEDFSFDLDTFLTRSEVELVVADEPAPLWETRWKGPERGTVRRLAQGMRTVRWEGETFHVVEAAWPKGVREATTMWWIGPSREAVERFAVHVAEIANEIRGEVLVFANGCWNRSTQLRDAIRSATFDNLVLPPGHAEQIVGDFRQFLDAREEYARYGAPWKRGVLLVGPPGNGKTHCAKALLNTLELPCLYIQSFESPGGNPQSNVHAAFERARRTTPCALVLEDLDALVTPLTRSFFLNELDGFASNEGIVTIATTNHAERLDPAILDRPSRFDRKYHFGLPAEPERLAFMLAWNESSEAASRLEEEGMQKLAAETEGFSYAYVKELMLSSLMAWVSGGRADRRLDVALAQVIALRAQMRSSAPSDERSRYVAEWGFPAHPGLPDDGG